jgi:hypothetical protein
VGDYVGLWKLERHGGILVGRALITTKQFGSV